MGLRFELQKEFQAPVPDTEYQNLDKLLRQARKKAAGHHVRWDMSEGESKAEVRKSPNGQEELTAIVMDISQDKYLKELHESVRVSRQIQLHLLPSEPPDLPGIELSAVNIPSRVVSGDYYDFIKILDDHWRLVMGDVTGKAVVAGLLMSAFRAALLSEIRNDFSLSTVLAEVNDLR